MAASRDLPLLLMIVCLVLIRGYTPLATTSTRVKGKNLTRPLRPRGSSPGSLDLNSSDYYEDLDGVDTPKPVTPGVRVPDAGTRQQCKFNLCLENQTPCQVLRANTGCACPGFTLHNMLPEAPNLQSVHWNGSEVVVQWCAPLSHLTTYRVTVGGREQARFGPERRSGGIGDIRQSTPVCVAAVSDAGVGKESCATFDPKDNSLALKAGLIGGALGFLLLFTLLLLLWRHRKQRRAESRISMQGVAET